MPQYSDVAEPADLFSLLSGMVTENDRQVQVELSSTSLCNVTVARCGQDSLQEVIIANACDVEEESPLKRSSLWLHAGPTCTLVDSCARLLIKLQSQGFVFPWACNVCSFSNASCLGRCDACKTINDQFKLSLDAVAWDSNNHDHILLTLAQTKGHCEVEACFEICEAMADELLDIDAAVPHYRRAFRLWPALDGDMRSDGVPLDLCAEADNLSATRGPHSLTTGTCPILGECRAEIASLRPPAQLQFESHDPLLETFDVEGVAKYMLERPACRIVVICGAGISTSAGIPDFRSPGSGLYDNLKKYNLPTAEAMFSLSYFRNSPGAFYELARELWPGNFTPTPCHYFIRLLHEKGILLRCYSQNIDNLELEAGLPAEKLVAAHGNFDGAHVIDTCPKFHVDAQELKAAIDQGEHGWRDLCFRKGGLVKPNIVFFGEALPDRFADLQVTDLAECDFLLVLGTSLVVAPFNSLISKANANAPRLLVNRERVGLCEYMLGGFQFHHEEANHRDVFYEGEVDDGVFALADALGWKADLAALMRSPKVCAGGSLGAFHFASGTGHVGHGLVN